MLQPDFATGSAEPASGLAFAARGIVKRFGSLTVLGGVDVSAAEGEFLSLLGPSGCGKTTLLRILAGLERQDAGSVTIRNRSVDALSPAARNLGMVFQNYALFPNMTVAGNIGFPLRFRPSADPAAEVARLISVVRLDGLEGRYPRQLSGGQQQRVAFARALAGSPALVLLDEPLSALDAKVRQELRLELKRLQRETGLTLVYVTHDQEEALALSDRIALMHQGRIAQIGSPREIYFRPANRFVADFIGRSNLLEGRFDAEGVTLADGRRLALRGPWRGPGTLVIRPEMLRPDPEGPLEGQMREAAFLGTAVEVEVEIMGRPWTVLLPPGADLARGATIRLSVAPEAAFIAERNNP